MRLSLAISFLCSSAAVAVKFSPANKNFGHSIKNGVLPPYPKEVTCFEHTCTSPPCTVTQLHAPSIYPHNQADWDWQDGTLRFYIDDDANLTLAISLLELSWVSEWAVPPHSALKPGASGGSYDNRGLPWNNLQFGHTAASGGVMSTLRIPFGKSLRVTIQAPSSTTTDNSVFWLIVRGIESLPVSLGELELPAEARLKIYRNTNVSLSHLDMLTIADVPSGKSGALLGTKFDAVSSGYGYLEACMRFYPSANASSPMFLSSGAEDYFLSASYFDEGLFTGPNAGLTFKDGRGGVGAYKMHDLRDQVLFHDGMKLQWRSGESTAGCGSVDQCPNQFCPSGADAMPTDPVIESAHARVLKERAERIQMSNLNLMSGSPAPPAPPAPPGKASYSTLVYVYEWSNTASSEAVRARTPIQSLLSLVEKKALVVSDSQLDWCVDALLATSADGQALAQLIDAMPELDSSRNGDHEVSRAVGLLQRYIHRHAQVNVAQHV